MVISATKPERGPVQLEIRFARRAGTRAALQSHTFTFELSRRSFRFKEDLGSATLATAGQLGPFGRITLRFTGGSSGLIADGPCERYSERSGNLRPPDGGGLIFKTGTKYFGTVRRGSYAAVLRQTSLRTDGECREGSGCRNLVSLTSDHPFRGDVVSALKNTSTGRVTQFYSVIEEDTAPAQITHLIRTSAPPEAFTATRGVQRAKLAAPGGQPFLEGSLRFAATGSEVLESPGCVTTFSSGGKVTGDLTATFDVGGTRSFTQGDAVDAVVFRSKRA